MQLPPNYPITKQCCRKLNFDFLLRIPHCVTAAIQSFCAIHVTGELNIIRNITRARNTRIVFHIHDTLTLVYSRAHVKSMPDDLLAYNEVFPYAVMVYFNRIIRLSRTAFK